MPRRSILLFAAACIAIAVGLAVATTIVLTHREPATGAQAGASGGSGAAQVGGPFTLVDQDGRTVDQSLLNDKWSLVFFGFTYCPDYCPTTLTTLKAVKEQLGRDGDNLQILFVSVDPERDTPAALKDYLSTKSFPQGVIGLTGTPEQVAGVAKAYRAYYEKVGSGDGYTMNHSLTIYLMGPDGRFRSAVSESMGPEQITRSLRQVMQRG